MGSLFGGGQSKPKQPPPVERKTMQNYNPATHTSQVTPLKRNPNVLGGPGAEAQLAKWDVMSKRYDELYTARTKNPNTSDKRVSPRYGPNRKELDRLSVDLQALESSIMDNIYRAPAGYGQQAPAAQTPAPTAPAPTAPAPTAPAPAAQAPAAQTPAAPGPAAAPAAPATAGPGPGSAEAPAGGNILGMTGTMGTGGAAGRSPRRRGRMQTLLTGFGGSAETLGG